MNTLSDIIIKRDKRIKELEKRRNKAKELAKEKATASTKMWKKIFKESINVLILAVVAGGIGYTLWYIAGRN